MQAALHNLTDLLFQEDDQDLAYLSSKIIIGNFEIRVSETLDDDENTKVIGYHVSVYSDGLCEQEGFSIAPIFTRLMVVPGEYFLINQGHINYKTLKLAAQCAKAIHTFIRESPHGHFTG